MDIGNLIAKIHECKGGQDLFIWKKLVELDRLIEIAKIRSTEASNKIETYVYPELQYAAEKQWNEVKNI